MPPRSSGCAWSCAGVRTGSARASACRHRPRTPCSGVLAPPGCGSSFRSSVRCAAPSSSKHPGPWRSTSTASGSLERGGGRRGPNHYRHNTPSSGVGWNQLFVAIDLASRLVYAELRGGIGNADMTGVLAAAVAFVDARGIRVDRVLTDNAFRSTFTTACSALGIRHRHTKPYHPWTNGRAEAFIGTIQRECVYDARFTADAERAFAIARYVACYNARRPHTALGGLSPERWLRARGVTQVYEDFS